jgi:hypothetical protein
MDDAKVDEGTSNVPPAPDFERVEYASGPGGNRCQLCQGVLTDSYYQVNGKVACAGCRGRIEVGEGGLSRRERVIMATVYGAGAALIGSVVWYLVSRLTGMELGIIAIGIGLLVGRGVQKGSRARGGRGYQALAMILTYLSIVTSYVPAVVTGIMKHQEKDAATASAGATGTPTADSGAGAAKPSAATSQKAGGKPMNPLLALVVFGALVLGIAIVAPFLAGASNFMGWLIIAIALYEAWKINRRMPLSVLGPFQLAPAPAGAGTPPETAGLPVP